MDSEPRVISGDPSVFSGRRLKLPLLCRLAGTVGVLGLTACEVTRDASTGIDAGQDYQVASVGILDDVDDVRDAFIDGRHQLWVLGHSQPFIRIYDTGGRRLSEGGRRGRGPTDLLFPSTFIHPADSGSARPLLLDIGRHDLLTLDGQLHVTSVVPARTVVGNMRADMISLVSQLPNVAVARGDTLLVVRIDGSAGTAIDLTAQSVVRTVGTRDTVLWHAPLDRSTRLSWLVGYPLWDACADGSLVGVDANGTTISRIRHDGRVEAFALPSRSRRATSEADLVALYTEHLKAEYRDARQPILPPADLERSARRIVANSGWQATDSLPVFGRLSCLERNTVLLQSFSPDERHPGKTRWMRVRGDSVDLHWFPQGFQPLSVEKGSFVGLLYDSLQVASLATIKPLRK